MDSTTRSPRIQDPTLSNPQVLTRRELRALEAASGAIRPRRRLAARRLAAKGVTVAAMAFVALLTVGVSIPASAFGGYEGQSSITRAAAAIGKAQILTVAADSTASAARDGYQATTRAQFAAAAAAAARSANAAKSASARAVMGFNPTGTGPVRWPFPVSVRLGPGFGAPSTCSVCQAVHQGQDFLPGNGAPIYAIAAGTVIKHQESGSTWGNYVVIQHQIDGQTVTSLYSHMQPGSSALNPGDQVQAGQFVGLTGTTGAVTAPVLHLEMTVGGAKVDPYSYLQARAG